MPPAQSVVLVDTMAIKVAHDFGCWNAIRKLYCLHSVPKCIDEATRANKDGKVLVRRTADELSAELTLGKVDATMIAKLIFAVGGKVDINEGEKHLLAYATSLHDVWYFCGPDNGTAKAMTILEKIDRMVSLETLALAAGKRLKELPKHFSEGWVSNHRTQYLLGKAGGF